MRNRLVHGYHQVNIDVVWDTVERDLPVLERAAHSLLETLEAED
jgi:uncharacterized protein with HEPN domain